LAERGRALIADLESCCRGIHIVCPAARGLLGLYRIGYGMVRFGIGFFREPDPHLRYVLGPFTMGQVLCAAMVLVGLAAYGIGRRAAQKVAVP